MITCGDLGTEPDELEARLMDVFLFAVNWKAILLLDEADVFLQERDLYDLKRNALVSIFLRYLEYFEGLLFMTTNRPGQIDEAFQSRIHITLGLPDLTLDDQADVWDIFIRKLKVDDKKKDELSHYVRSRPGLRKKLNDVNYQMNGRQIRNCMRSAIALANKANRPVCKDDIRKVVKIGIEFRDYMLQVKGQNQEHHAEALGLRARASKSAKKEVSEAIDKVKEKLGRLM